jgi:putative oxidoreductase
MKQLPNQSQAMILVGRVLIAMIFISSGLSKIPGWDATASYMASKGVPWVPLFLFPAIFVEVLGGLSILVGLRAKLGATALILYLIPVTLIFHNFWAFNGMERQIQLVNFMKNLAVMGGLCEILAHGAGMLSLDYKLSRRTFTSSEHPRDKIRAVS